MTFTNLSETPGGCDLSSRLDALRPPDQGVKMVLDTDAYNEIDDQFALAYALVSASLDVEAVYAAPFHNNRSSGPEDGMEKSYDEILRLLKLLGDSDSVPRAFRGAAAFTSTAGAPVVSPAAEDLIDRATGYSSENPLYVASIGAPTNVASALELAPEIAESIVVVWLGGHPHSWHTADEFNLKQDLRASQMLFDSGVPLVQVPCKNVAEHVRTSVSELATHLDGGGELAEYLLETFVAYGRLHGSGPVWSKEIWDVAPIAFLVDHELVPTHLSQSPLLTDDSTYSFDPRRHLIRVAADVHRDAIFRDLFEKIRNC